ncbi:hypothetical protein B0T26DRAFT_648981 [Lasiosphaeria miniovina]|uniref:Uncharacterized protein n=1 Tax=Lasiosphaeria miniovina TaxID=1954250 RepID=A0AA40DQJ3_9PEZI|nr:uncharacterized protein B0T26DRAFT_648981 [Lasiosphaeria miniovina]KAK0712399.1 hypothetical protein B0T26DRAFT_648981 [Lasiosphaeria miniovina]
MRPQNFRRKACHAVSILSSITSSVLPSATSVSDLSIASSLPLSSTPVSSVPISSAVSSIAISSVPILSSTATATSSAPPAATTTAVPCIDCSTKLIEHSNWDNGLLYTGNYYAPVKGAGWGKGTSSNGDGTLELRSDASGYYVYSMCPKTHSGYCRSYINTVVSLTAGVEYDFTTIYSMSNVRNQVDILEIYVESFDRSTRYFDHWIYSGSTAGWTTFQSLTFTATKTEDVVFTMTWRNDPNDAVVLFRSISMSPTECHTPTSDKTC